MGRRAHKVGRIAYIRGMPNLINVSIITYLLLGSILDSKPFEDTYLVFLIVLKEFHSNLTYSYCEIIMYVRIEIEKKEFM